MNAEGPPKKRLAHDRHCRWGRLVTSTKKAVILILSSAAGTVIGYGVFLFGGLGLLMLYGDNGGPFKIRTVFYVLCAH